MIYFIERQRRPINKTVQIDYTWIDREETFTTFLKKLERGQTVCLDTEADNMHHYETRLCLLQVGVGEEGVGEKVALIDPFGEFDWTPMLRVMEEKDLVMHGSDFDFRLLSHWGGFRPKALFDTMHAAQLLGHARVGLGALAEHYLGIKMIKGHQKDDWSKRPLPPKMLHYAALDAHILHELKWRMESEIRAKGREQWLQERCQWQVASGNNGFAEKDENSWRILQWRKLSSRGLVNLYHLMQWREKKAQSRDLPLFKILHNQTLFSLADKGDQYPKGPWKEALSPRLRQSRGSELEEVLRRAAAFDASDLPSPPARKRRPEPLTAEENERQTKILEKRDRVAAEMEIDPSLLANRQQVSILARDPAKAEELLLPTPRKLLGL